MLCYVQCPLSPIHCTVHCLLPHPLTPVCECVSSSVLFVIGKPRSLRSLTGYLGGLSITYAMLCQLSVCYWPLSTVNCPLSVELYSTSTTTICFQFSVVFHRVWLFVTGTPRSLRSLIGCLSITYAMLCYVQCPLSPTHYTFHCLSVCPIFTCLSVCLSISITHSTGHCLSIVLPYILSLASFFGELKKNIDGLKVEYTHNKGFYRCTFSWRYFYPHTTKM